MNLIFKISNYIYLRRRGIKHPWIKSPLTNIDKLMILFAACGIVIALVLAYANEIDSYNINLTDKLSRKIAQNANNEAVARKNELLVVSMLNGSIIVNGRVKSLCVYDAGGSCK